ncbi:MAG: cell division protein FtsX [Gammaproteobacteria bacterium]|nr:MAG: cell division protein FtsX [Gammaproteobacteria bacterium]
MSTPLPLLERLRAWAAHHAYVFFSSLGRLCRQPLSSALTIAVLAVALALPAGFGLLLTNVRHFAGDWQGAGRLTVYLRPEARRDQAEALAAALRDDARIASVTLIDKDQALAEFKRASGFGAALDALPDNPLPHALVLEPAPTAAADPAALEALRDALTARPEVELVQLDLDWLQRLLALLDLAQRGVRLIGVLLGLAVLLIVGNTIRLDIQARADEIRVTKLIGATDAFIRRPFLYTGFWYGLFGALGAAAVLAAAWWLLRAPLGRLLALYTGLPEPLGPDAALLGRLLALGIGQGIAGAALAVGRHLKAIEPR